MVPQQIRSARPELAGYLGQRVDIVREASASDEGYEEERRGSIVRLPNGEEVLVYNDELTEEIQSANQGPAGGPNAFHPSQVHSAGMAAHHAAVATTGPVVADQRSPLNPTRRVE